MTDQESRQNALDAISLKPVRQRPHTAYSIEMHSNLVRRTAGAAADANPWDASVRRKFLEAWGINFLWSVNDGLVNWGKQGRVTDMGHAEYDENGKDRRDTIVCPFHEPEEVWAFDPAKEYGLPGFAEQVAAYQKSADDARAAYPGQLATGGYYKTVVSGAIQAFGWDMLLTAAADPDQFAKVLQRFGDYTAFYAKAWAATDVEAYIQHDDMVWTSGPFMSPDFYRQVIFPIYKRLWAPLKAAGKKILYCSDGTFDMFMDDILACGADGLIFEPSNPWTSVVKRFGGKCCLVGSAVDCVTLTIGTWPQVQAQIDETFAAIRGLPGIILAVGNHMPPNITEEMCERYIAALKARWASP